MVKSSPSANSKPLRKTLTISTAEGNNVLETKVAVSVIIILPPLFTNVPPLIVGVAPPI